MTVNAAIFTCSICGEASTDICAYCTKDACSNHRCVRCNRCSDCCECDVPLSAEEPVVMEPHVETIVEPVQELEVRPHQAEPELPEPPQAEFHEHPFLTPAEASIFSDEPVKPKYVPFSPLDDPAEPGDPSDPTE